MRHPHSSSFYQTTLEWTTNLIIIRVANVFGQPKYSQQIWSLNWLRSKIPTERSGSSLSSHIGISVTISFLFWRIILPLYSSWRYRYCYWRQWPFRRRPVPHNGEKVVFFWRRRMGWGDDVRRFSNGWRYSRPRKWRNLVITSCNLWILAEKVMLAKYNRMLNYDYYAANALILYLSSAWNI